MLHYLSILHQFSLKNDKTAELNFVEILVVVHATSDDIGDLTDLLLSELNAEVILPTVLF